MNLAQEVRNRRIIKMAEKHEKETDSNIYAVFRTLLKILDNETIEMNFGGVDVFEGDANYKQFVIEPDGFYQFDTRLVTFNEEVNTFEFMNKLKICVESEEGYIAEMSKYASNTNCLHINIK